MIDGGHPADALSGLLDGELDLAEAEVVRAHLVACPDCAAEVVVVRDVRASLRSMPAVDPPAGFFEGPRGTAQDRRVPPIWSRRS